MLSQIKNLPIGGLAFRPWHRIALFAVCPQAKIRVSCPGCAPGVCYRQRTLPLVVAERIPSSRCGRRRQAGGRSNKKALDLITHVLSDCEWLGMHVSDKYWLSLITRRRDSIKRQICCYGGAAAALHASLGHSQCICAKNRRSRINSDRTRPKTTKLSVCRVFMYSCAASLIIAQPCP